MCASFLSEPTPLLRALPWEWESIPFNQYSGGVNEDTQM